jgi:hypothetical protein
VAEPTRRVNGDRYQRIVGDRDSVNGPAATGNDPGFNNFA